MHPRYEIVFTGKDNRIDLALKVKVDDEWVPADLTDVTRMTLSFGGEVAVDTDTDADSITWMQPGYADGEIRMKLGDQGLQVGLYDHRNPLHLVVYAPQYPNGIVWPPIPCIVKAEVAEEAGP